MTQDSRPPSRAHPLRSPVLAPSVKVHVLSIVLCLIGTLALAIALLFLGSAVGQHDSETGGILMVFGYILLFAPLFSWAGHIPGAFVLHGLLRRGLGGWLSAAGAGLLVGLVLTWGTGANLALLLAPVLAVMQLVILRGLILTNVRAESPGDDQAG